jgi:uncharacterized protein YjlB
MWYLFLEMRSMQTTQRNTAVKHFYLRDDGTFPNNSELPVLLYKSAWVLPFFKVRFVKRQLKNNKWNYAWRNGVYEYHHYHSTAHEVLCVIKGNAKLLLGGNKGMIVEVEEGDVLVIPAGVAHKNMTPRNTFKCIGAYPQGQNYDMNYGKFIERPRTDEQIKKVPLPLSDPVYGETGPLMYYWKVQ